MSLPLNQIVVGDCTEVMRTWPADSIDLVVTSPPYWGLRDYGEETVKVWGPVPKCEHEWAETVEDAEGYTSKRRWQHGINRDDDPEKWSREVRKYSWCQKCGAWRGSLGLEPHPQMYVDHLVEICREIRRVLKPTGTFFLNLGDTYYGGPYRGSETIGTHRKEVSPPFKGPPKNLRSNWLQPKQKLMIPARVAIALQHEGWILRSDIIWHKPNAMPSSVKDRLTCVHEHIFMFAKQRRYYFDLDAIRKPHAYPETFGTRPDRGKAGEGLYAMEAGKRSGHSAGKNPGDLWRIPTRPFPGAHFATFPPKLIEPIIKAGSPRWVCSRCGKPRTRILEEGLSFKDKEIQEEGLSETRYTSEEAHNPHSLAFRRQAYRKLGLEGPPPKKTVGWSDCGCGEKWVGGVVLDPFGGSGTVGQVARRLGRRFILIEIIPEYCKMAEQRVRGKYKPVPEGVTPFMESEGNG